MFGALEVTSGVWVYRLGRRCAADFTALLDHLANTAVTWPARLRQIRSFFRARSPDQMLAAAAAPWTSPWLPPGYEQNFWNAALVTRASGQNNLTFRYHSTSDG